MNPARVAALLSQGLSVTQVSTIVGCTPARISQLKQEESFKLLLADKTSEVEKEGDEDKLLSTKYTALEHQLIAQMSDIAISAEMRDVTAALRVVAERQDRMRQRATPAAQHSQQVVVAITLPSHAIPGRIIEMTKEREVISIGEQTIAPLTSTAVTELFTQMKEKKQNQLNGGYHEPSTGNPSTEASSQATLCEEVEEVEKQYAFGF